MEQRTITKITQASFRQGFLGKGHRAAAVLDGLPYEYTDPFIVFMDDRLDLPGGEPVGGAHPHAGFETLTLVLKGNEEEWQTGSFELMTAGKGIVHTEEISAEQNIHILQVWLALPPDKRWAAPSWQKMLLANVPAIKTDQYEILVYSGTSNGLVSPIKNHTPLTLIDFKIKNNQRVVQPLPAGYNGLIYILNGVVKIAGKTIEAGQAGWLNKSTVNTGSEIEFLSAADDTHFVLYAAQSHHTPIVSHGPFIGDSMDDIARLYREYRNGEMPHLNDLPGSQKTDYSLQSI